MKVSILGPSHAKQLAESKLSGELQCPPNFYIKGIQSCPIFSEHMIEEVTARSKLSDYVYVYSPASMRFNFLHEKMNERLMISKAQHDFYFNEDPYLYEPDLLKDKSVVSTMDHHLRKWLDWYSAEFSNVSFIFWCDFVSEKKSTKESREIKRDSYSSLARNYKHLDLEALVSFSGGRLLDMLKTNQSHKNLYGQQQLIKFLSYLHK